MTDHAHSHAHDEHGHSAGSQGHEAGAHGHDDHGGNAKYIKVFLALCVLTLASFFTYSDAWPFHDTPSVGWAFMMAVSCTKALLVMLFFMHLKWEADWKYVLTIPASVMSIFLMLALVPDIGMRVKGNYGYHYSEWRMNRIGMPTDATEMEHVSEKLHPVDGTAKH
ncbi:MAG: cytochrome C oxidase subunit IV family protein [Planctomycetaceae bacterium]|nr:cytochrome C oxidase subunit IV family protein [Planctomycetaceae bacterium]